MAQPSTSQKQKQSRVESQNSQNTPSGISQKIVSPKNQNEEKKQKEMRASKTTSAARNVKSNSEDDEIRDLATSRVDDDEDFEDDESYHEGDENLEEDAANRNPARESNSKGNSNSRPSSRH